MADKADGSVVLAQLQIAFLWECDNKGLSPCGLPFSCLPYLLQIVVWMSIMASLPVRTNSAGMLSTAADFLIFSALTADSTSSSGICGQSRYYYYYALSVLLFTTYIKYRNVKVILHRDVSLMMKLSSNILLIFISGIRNRSRNDTGVGVSDYII